MDVVSTDWQIRKIKMIRSDFWMLCWENVGKCREGKFKLTREVLSRVYKLTINLDLLSSKNVVQAE